MSNPKISIIVIYKNDENTIKYCIDSIFNQKFRDFEIICFNNGSTDKTEGILQELKLGRENLYLINLNSEQNIKEIQSSAVSIAGGDYICFLEPSQIIYEKFPSGINNKTFNPDISGYNIENGKIYRREFLENNGIIDKIISDKILAHIDNIDKKITDFKEYLNEAVNNNQKLNIENIDNKVYDITNRVNQLEKTVFDHHDLFKNELELTFKNLNNIQEDNKNTIYEDISKVYDYINNEINQKGTEISNVYEEVTRCYKYTENLIEKLHLDMLNEINNKIDSLIPRIENLENEITVRYTNLKRVMDIQTEEFNQKLEALKEEMIKK